jgi:hypothetical protein
MSGCVLLEQTSASSAIAALLLSPDWISGALFLPYKETLVSFYLFPAPPPACRLCGALEL